MTLAGRRADEEEGEYNYMPVIYGSFEEKGRKFEVWMPSSGSEPQEFTVNIYKDEAIIEELHVPMDYEPRFGVDTSDVARLEERVGKYIDALKE